MSLMNIRRYSGKAVFRMVIKNIDQFMGRNLSDLVRMPKYGLITQPFFVESGQKFVYKCRRPLAESRAPKILGSTTPSSLIMGPCLLNHHILLSCFVDHLYIKRSELEFSKFSSFAAPLNVNHALKLLILLMTICVRVIRENNSNTSYFDDYYEKFQNKILFS